MEAVLETAATLIVVTEASGRIVLFNRACEGLSGYGREEVLGQNLIELLVAPKWRAVVARRFADLEAPEVRQPHENPWRTKSGRQVWIEWRCLPLSLPGRGSPLVVATGQEISDRRKAEKAGRDADILRIQEEERRRVAQELHDELGQLLAGVQFHLRGILEKVKERYPELHPSVAKALDRLDEAVVAARASAHRLDPAPRLREGLKNALRESCREFQERTGIVLRLSVSPRVDLLPGKILTQLYRIVMEALTNVEKHSGASEVAVRVAIRGDKLRLKIHDNGKGMDLESPWNRSRLKEGLGLAGMQKRAVSLGGHFHIDSGEGRGTILLVEVSLGSPKAEKSHG